MIPARTERYVRAGENVIMELSEIVKDMGTGRGMVIGRSGVVPPTAGTLAWGFAARGDSFSIS